MTSKRASASAKGRSDRLETFVAAARRDVERRRGETPHAALERLATNAEPHGREFVSVLSRRERTNVIAECKRRSPSRGLLCTDYAPAALGAAYERAGAAAVSVLTEPHFFGGSLADLSAVRAATRLPLLRKDFVVSEYQLLEARAEGADAVLLIAAALDLATLAALLAAATALGLAALVEVHDAGDLSDAVGLGAELIGINCRDLRTLDVDTKTAERLIPLVPPGAVVVAESGIRSPVQLKALKALGYDAFLIGEALVRSPNPGETLGEWLAECARPAPAATPSRGRPR